MNVVLVAAALFWGLPIMIAVLACVSCLLSGAARRLIVNSVFGENGLSPIPAIIRAEERPSR